MKTALFILGIFIATSALAQQHFVGITVGGGLSNVHGGKVFKHRSEKPVLQGGISYTYRFSDMFHFETNLIYAERGFHNDIIFTDEVGVPTGESVFIDFNFNYLSLPLKGGVHFGKKVIGFMRIGIAPAILLDAKTIEPAVLDNLESTTNITSRISQFDVAALLEIGGDLPLSRSFSVSTTATFMHSFRPVTNKNYFPDENMLNYGLILSIGVKYALGKN